MKNKHENSIETIYSQIKNFLLSSDIYPGQKIPHAELGQKMGISFSPLREAFIQLATEGLLIHKNQRGFFVPEISYDEARELYDARILIEPHLVKEAAQFITEKKIKIIDEIQKQYHKMAHEPYSRERLLVDKRFHLEIMEMGGNSKLLRIVDGIFDLLIVRRSILHLSPSRPHKAHKEHSEIFEALKKRDGKKASQLMKKHINIIKNFVIDDLRNRQNGFKSSMFG
jgi:DNA-binding GntR family transcriptional regulator